MESDETSVRAGEYVLGLLTEPERRAFEAEMARDAELRGEVELWQSGLARLFDGAEEAPPRQVARRLQDRLFGAAAREPLAHGAWIPDWLTAALVVKAVAILSLVLWLLLSL